MDNNLLPSLQWLDDLLQQIRSCRIALEMREAFAAVIIDLVSLREVAILYYQFQRSARCLSFLQRFAQTFERIGATVDVHYFHSRAEACFSSRHSWHNIPDPTFLV